MGSSIDLSRLIVYRGSRRQRRIYGPKSYDHSGAFDYVFDEPGGRFRRDIEDLMPALVPHEHGDLQDTIAVPQHPGPPVITQPQPEPAIDMIGALYAPHFRRLEQELLSRSTVHVPAFVSAGRVAQGSLEVDTAAGVTEPVLLSVLEEYVPANQAK